MGINLATKITLFRIFCIPIFLFFFINGDILWAVIVFLISAITDGIDGFIARAYNQKTALGSILDPLADKLLLSTAMIVLAFKFTHLAWIAILIVSRDVILIAGALLIFLNGGVFEIKPNISGKISTVLQIVMVAIGLICAARNQHEILHTKWFLGWMLLTAFFTILAAYYYVRKGLQWLLEQTTKP